MGDGYGSRAHFHNDFADQIVDDASHNRVKASRWFIKKDNFGIRCYGTGKANTLLHAAR